MERYIKEIMKGSGYLDTDSDRIARKLVRGYSIHEEVINEPLARELGLKIKNSGDFPEEWTLLRKWLGPLLMKASGIHLIRYVIDSGLRKDLSADTKLSSEETEGAVSCQGS